MLGYPTVTSDGPPVLRGRAYGDRAAKGGARRVDTSIIER